MTGLLSESISCYECNKTFEGSLVDISYKECKSCKVFVCLDCIISCDLNKDYAEQHESGSDLFFYEYEGGVQDGPNTCGTDDSVSHKGCRWSLQVCGCEWKKVDRDIRGGKVCEYTFCENHSEGTEVSTPLPNAEYMIEVCTDCDQWRCSDCSIPFCLSCSYSSCIDKDCGGYCDSCVEEHEANGIVTSVEEGLCEDHMMKCWDADCERGFCEKHESDMQICKACERHSCIDHLEHKCEAQLLL